MKVFLLIALVGVASSSPLPQILDSISGFFNGLTGDSGDLEEVPYKTISKEQIDGLAYEIREYPSVKWVCKQMEYKLGAKPRRGQFMPLFRYISGENEGKEEIAMTRPVLSKMTPDKDTMSSNMCFYLDSGAQANPPTPTDQTVKIETNKPFRAAVYEFGGYSSEDIMEEAKMCADRDQQAVQGGRLRVWRLLLRGHHGGGEDVCSEIRGPTEHRGHRVLLRRGIRQPHEVLEQEERSHVRHEAVDCSFVRPLNNKY